MAGGTYALNFQYSATANTATIAGAIITSGTTTGDKLASLVQALTTTPAALTIGNLSNIGVLMVKNLSSVNVTLSKASDGTQILSVIPPGQGVFLLNLDATPYAKVASGTGSILISAGEQ